MKQYVFRFGGGGAEGAAAMRAVLGGKGANLAEMSRLGLPVPPGFTLSAELCAPFNESGGKYPEGAKQQAEDALRAVERETGARFGDPGNPLLLSVRSGARASMPGMLDTVLNLGLNDATADGLARRSGDARFAADSYRRFIQMYGAVVLGVDRDVFEEILDRRKERRGLALDADLAADDWRRVAELYKAKIEETLGAPFPLDPHTQLWGAIDAVFRSWTNRRAETYRKLNGIPSDWGTAVTVQAMAFGNMGGDSASGVAFTRNPSTGAREPFGEFLVNTQGEDVVAGVRTPHALTAAAAARAGGGPSLEELMPGAWAHLARVLEKLETHYRDMQDVEFTVQQGKLHILQTRAGKRSAAAALRIAVDMANEGLIDRREAVRRIHPEELERLLHPTLAPGAERDVIARGLAASPGAASGRLALTADDAEARARAGQDVILARMETSPEDIHGMHAARGIVTARGGMTSHAAVVARGMGRPCVTGAGDLGIDLAAGALSAGGATLRAGDIVTVDGTAGELLRGAAAMARPDLGEEFDRLMEWADEFRTLRVRANAETPADARAARELGAEGIGLCRTEHMFFDETRILAIRRAIMSETEDERRRALADILPMQRRDFIELFGIMAGRPVTIRLLDPPLHEFLPRGDSALAEMARATGAPVAEVERRASQLRETNPMLGHRGCRLGLSYPEIYEMQARAVFEAAIAVGEKTGAPVAPEIMIPLAATGRELALLAERIAAVAREVAGEASGEGAAPPPYLFGAMIELPRACIVAGHLASAAQFFSFGTNDLTQTAFGASRDDSARFLERYAELGILEDDPFVTLDEAGVGELVSIAIEGGRTVRPDLKLGVCGEHGGDPRSIAFFHRAGLEYVSCSPYRVPVARLAAARAALEDDA